MYFKEKLYWCPFCLFCLNLSFFSFWPDVECKHETNTYVSVKVDDTSCNGRSYYACKSGFKQVAGNAQRTCEFGGIMSGYPLVCSGLINLFVLVEFMTETQLVCGCQWNHYWPPEDS